LEGYDEGLKTRAANVPVPVFSMRSSTVTRGWRQGMAWRGIVLLLGWVASAGLLQAGIVISPPSGAGYPEDVHDHQPAGLTLKLSLPKDHFFQGEKIPATLTFSNKSQAAYHACAANWDRSRVVMGDIFFRAQSDKGESVVDPVVWYLRQSMGGGGGGGTMVNLGEWSTTVAANQWLRFDHPGVYTIYVWSNRVQTGIFRDFQHLSDSDEVQLVSNQVTITIDPLTPEEERAVIEQARRVLSQPREASFMPEDLSPEVTEALSQLCYLQTPAARAELFPYLGEGNNDAGRLVALGILGASDPQAVAPALLASVERGKPVLNEFIVEIYAALKTYDFPGGGFGLHQTFPATPFTKAVQDAKNEITEAARKASGGEGPVLVGALWTTFQQKPQDPAVRAALVQHQLELSADERKELIFKWQSEVWADAQLQDPAVIESMKQFRQGGPDLLPVLLKAATAPDYDPYALAILCKVGPDQARPLVIEDIKRDHSLYLTKPHTHFSVPDGLDALPDQPIPELTETFRQKLAEKDIDASLLLPLIDRYGTVDLLPDVVRFYKPKAGNWECAVENACLRFWIRCDPPAGMASLEYSLQSRKETRCYAYLLEKVFKDRWNDLAQPVVVKALDDPNPDVVLSAIKTLEGQGNQDCIESVISALERIHTTTPPSLPDEEPVSIQKAQQGTLARELLRSQRWDYSPAQTDRLKKIGDRSG
jgi:hypothetical protein